MGLLYVWLLQRLFSVQGRNSESVSPLLSSGMLLPMCMFCILIPHVPALWSGRVNLDACVGRLEASLLYFVLLQLLLLYCGSGLVLSTLAALCLGWHSVQGASREWIHSPLLLQTSITLFFVAFVPLLWSTHQPLVEKGWSHLMLCDLSLVLLEASLRVYGMLFAL